MPLPFTILVVPIPTLPSLISKNATVPPIPIFTSSLNVEIPETLSSSKSLRPSTVRLVLISTEALISRSEANVEIPETFRVPSTSSFAVALSVPIPTFLLSSQVSFVPAL